MQKPVHEHMLFLAFSIKKWTFSLPDGPMLYLNTTTSTCPPFTPGPFWNAPCLLVRSRNKLGGQVPGKCF